MLESLQRRIAETYQADTGHDVRDFLITDSRVAHALSGGNVLTKSGETLLVREDSGGLAMSLYLEAGLLERLETGDPARLLDADRLGDLCKVIEGLSHFVCVAWRASRDQSVTLFELELQAEVDKYVGTMQLARETGDPEALHALHGRLFDSPRFSDDLDDEQRERYRAATEYAARFCKRLRQRMLSGGDAVLPELRHFFRLPLREKLSHIHSATWQAD